MVGISDNPGTRFYYNTTDSQSPFLKYLWEIGQIFVRQRKSMLPYPTHYHLVMDVTSPAKAVWIVFRCDKPDGSGLESVWQLDTSAIKWQPFAHDLRFHKQLFYSAQVFNTVKQWKGMNTPQGSFDQCSELANSTARKMPITFFDVPDLEKLKEIERGWALVKRS
jgi:hypothetical protein